jgi:hypothetical protein
MIRRARTRWWARSEIGVDPLGHEIRCVRHHANPGSLGRVWSETHLQRQVLGCAPEIVYLFIGQFVHYQLATGQRGVTGCCIARRLSE